jgi:hypothetical protein
MISGSPSATRLPAEQPLATGVGAGVGAVDESYETVGSADGLTDAEGLTDGSALADGNGDAEASQAVRARRKAKRRAAGRVRPQLTLSSRARVGLGHLVDLGAHRALALP